jgi:L-alanine-DL-glutamate epimerase-like enolase superfamily enzyme
MVSTAAGAAPIEGVSIHQIAFPLAKGMRSGIHLISTMYNVVVEIHAGGVSGVGYTFAFREFDVAAVREVATHLAGVLVGSDADDVAALHRRMWAEINFSGPDGLATMAASALDIALWDVRARRRGVSMSRYLGAPPTARRMYGSGGSLALTEDELVEEATSFLEKGYTGYKFRVGSPDLDIDFERVHLVRKHVGPHFTLAVDANQAWSRGTAAAALARLSGLGLAWVEEPIAADDIEGLAELRRGTTVPIAAGETIYGVNNLSELMRAGAIDLVQPDLMRCGGVTGLLQVAAVANSLRLSVAPHLYAEMNASLMAGIPTGTLIEHLDGWFEHLFDGGPLKADGSIKPEEVPGFGLALNRGAVETFGQVSVEV